MVTRFWHVLFLLVLPVSVIADNTRPARRVISLAPHLTEMVFEIGAGHRLVAVSEYSDYPPAAKKLPVVSSAGAIDLEKILSLEPDLILVWESGTPAIHRQRLRQLGIPVAGFGFERLEDINRGLRRLGRLTGQVNSANKAADKFLQRLALLRKEYSNKKTVRIFYQIWGQPVMTVNRHHMLNDVIEVCGGKNIFGDLEQLVATVDAESVVKRDPEVIVASSVNGKEPDWLNEWRRWPQLAAVANGHVGHINPDLIARQGTRVLIGTEKLCEQLQRARGTD